MKSKTTAALLAFFFGWMGGHKFYLGKGGQGILYLIFAWTFVPALIAWIDCIMLVVMSDAEFHARYNAGFPVLGVPTAPQNIVVNVANTAQAGSGGDTAGKIKQLHELRQVGALSETEFEAEKRKVLAGA